MNRKYFYFLFITLSVYLFPSCEENSEMEEDPMIEEEEEGDPTDTTYAELLPSYWEKDGEMRGKIFYDEQNRISEIFTYTNYSHGYYDSELIIEEYGPNGIVETTFNSDGGLTQKQEYFYVEGILDSIHIRAGGDQSYVKFSYSEDPGCNLTSHRYAWEDDPPITSNYTYLGENCSLDIEGGGTMNYQIITDDKKEFLYYREHFERHHYHYYTALPRHNIIKYEVTRSFDGSIFDSRSYTSEYTYNAQDYPLTEKRTYYNGDMVEYKFYYIEK